MKKLLSIFILVSTLFLVVVGHRSKILTKEFRICANMKITQFLWSTQPANVVLHINMNSLSLCARFRDEKFTVLGFPSEILWAKNLVTRKSSEF